MERQSTRKLFRLVVAALAIFFLGLSAVLFISCGEHTHDYQEDTSGTINADCGHVGVKTFKCSTCGDTYSIVSPTKGSHDFKNGYCSVCGLPDYTKVPEIPNYNGQFDSIQSAITNQQKAIDNMKEEDVAHTFDTPKTIEIASTCVSRGFKITTVSCKTCGASFITGIESAKLAKHSYKKLLDDTVYATCTDPGLVVWECSYCGVRYTEPTQAKGHTWEEVKEKSKAANCEEDGYTYYECSVCHDHKTDVIKSNGTQHQWNYDEAEILHEATCKDFGDIKLTCSVCGATRNEIINTVDHKKGAENEGVRKNPTCTADGTKYFQCEWCKQTFDRVDWNEKIDKLGHSFEEEGFVAPHKTDCEIDEQVTVKCTRCAVTKEMTAPAGVHTYKFSDFEQDECGLFSVKISCEVCSYTDTWDYDNEFVENMKRTVETSKEAEEPDPNVPNCEAFLNCLEEQGYRAQHGTVDASQYINFYELLANIPAADQPTETDPKLGATIDPNVAHRTYYICPDCEKEVEVSYIKERHSFAPSRLTTNGFGTEYTIGADGKATSLRCWDVAVEYYCTDTGCTATYHGTVKGLGHEWKGTWILTEAGAKTAEGKITDCEAPGTRFYYCARCNDRTDIKYTTTDGKEYRLNGEAWTLYDAKEEEFDTTDTKTLEQLTAAKAVKGYYSATPIVDATKDEAHGYKVEQYKLTHSKVPVIEKCKAPTCTVDGTYAFKCSVCGKEFTEKWAAEGHKWNYDDDEAWERVFGTEGAINGCQSVLERRTCTVCNATEDRKATPKIVHQGLSVKTNIQATCSTDGEITNTCDVCGQTWSEHVPALGHTFEGNGLDITGLSDEEKLALLEEIVKPVFDQYFDDNDGSFWSESVGSLKNQLGSGKNVFMQSNTATCRHPAANIYVCLRCGEVQVEILKEKTENHVWSDFVIDEEATCRNSGSQHKKCEVCGEVVYETIPQLDHWYYTKTREEAKKLGQDELEKYLNIVGKNESSCLTPDSVTVECVDCGVRYAYAQDGKATGHDWVLIREVDPANVTCGELKSTARLAVCANCGLVIDVTNIEIEKELYTEETKGTTHKAGEETGFVIFKDSRTYAKYLKNVPNLLTELRDENGNLNLKDYYKKGEDGTYAFTDKLTEQMVIIAYKSDEIQMHKFVDDDEHRLYILDGTCEDPGAYIVLCSICGGTAEKPNIVPDTKIQLRLDDSMVPGTEIEGTYWDIVAKFRDSYAGGTRAAYDELGYNNFNKDFLETFEYDLNKDDEKETVTNRQLFQALVADYLANKYNETGSEELAKAFDSVKNNLRYSGFNFAGFKFEPYAHDWLTNKNGSCEIDPMLTAIFEDWVGGTDGIFFNSTYKFSSNAFGIEHSGTLFGIGADGKYKYYKVSEVERLKNAFGETYKDYLDKSFEEYADVIDYLVGIETTAKDKAEAIKTALGMKKEGGTYKGIADWCQREACPLKDAEGETFTAGFVAAGEHKSIVNIFKDGYSGDVVVDENGDPVEFTLSTWKPEDKADIKNLGFLQYLYNNQADTTITGKYTTEIAALKALGLDLNELYVYATGKNGENVITCRTVELCKFCGRVLNKGSHVDPRGVNGANEYLANCQHGDQCVVCGDYTFNAATNHLLINYFDLSVELQAKVRANTKLKDLVPTGDKMVCWDENTQKSLYVCAGCLEANATTFTPAVKTNNKEWSAVATHNEKKDTWQLDETKIKDESAANQTTFRSFNAYSATMTDAEKAKLHTFQLTAKNLEKVAELLEIKLPTSIPTAQQATYKTLAEYQLAFVKTTILEKVGTGSIGEDGKIAYTLTTTTGSGNTATTTTAEGYVFFDESGNFVFQNDGKSENAYECIGGVYTNNLCLACAYKVKGKVSKNTTSWGTSGTKEVNKAVPHAYAPNANYTESNTYYVDEEGGLHLSLTCIRCGAGVTGYYKDYKADGSLATDELIEAYLEKTGSATEKTWVAAEAYEGEYMNQTFFTVYGLTEKTGHSVCKLTEEYTVATKVDSFDAAKSGYYTLSGEENTIAASAAAEITGDVVFELEEGAKLTATNGINVKEGASLTIKGGEVDGRIDMKGSAEKPATAVLEDVVTDKVVNLSAAADITISGSTMAGFHVYNSSEDAEKKERDYPINIIISDSTITAENGSQDSRALFLGKLYTNITLEISGCNIIGSDVGLSIMSGKKVTVSDCVIFGARIAACVRGGDTTFENCEFIVGSEHEDNEWTSAEGVTKDVEGALSITATGSLNGEGADDNGPIWNYAPTTVAMSGCKFSEATTNSTDGDSGAKKFDISTMKKTAEEDKTGLTQIGDTDYYYTKAEKATKQEVVIGVGVPTGYKGTSVKLTLGGDLAKRTYTIGENAFFYDGTGTSRTDLPGKTAKTDAKVTDFTPYIEGFTVTEKKA